MWKSKQIKTVIQMSMYRDHLFGWQTFFISLWRNATSASVHFVDTLQCYLWVSEFPVHSFNFLKKLQSKTFRSSEIGNLGNYSKISISIFFSKEWEKMVCGNSDWVPLQGCNFWIDEWISNFIFHIWWWEWRCWDTNSVQLWRQKDKWAPMLIFKHTLILLKAL